MKKKIMWTVIAIFVFVLLLVTVQAFIPQPIADSGIEEMIQVQVNFDYGNENSKLTDICVAPEKVIECISKYKEQRTLSRHKGYAMKNVELRVCFRTKSDIKDVIIGVDTYIKAGPWTEYRIMDVEQFRKDLFEACGVSLDKQEPQSFLATVLEETTSYMMVEPAEGEYERTVADKIKITYGADHYDYLYGIGRKVVIYYTGGIEATEPASIKTDDISTEGFRNFTLSVTPSENKDKKGVYAKIKDELSPSTLSLVEYDYVLYYYGLEEVTVSLDGQTLPLKEALEQGKITLNAIVAKANQDVTDGVLEELVYKDGGSQMYQYPDYTIIKYHTLDGNRDVYIGAKDMGIAIANQ